jgi:signal peptidase I
VEARDQSLASVIDTIEAIIIALVIALTFRAFIVEAFVIPTGSMAPTLLGAHFKVICPACGYAYDRDASLYHQIRQTPNGRRVIPGNRDPQAELISNTSVPCDAFTGDMPIYCPNCLNPIEPKQLPQYIRDVEVEDGRRGGALRMVPVPWANNGDRILVLKYLYPVVEPKRWDVIVFKEPQGAATNYIKRCAGLPGETIEIIGGDVYVNAPGATDEGTRYIARKPDHIQQSLWQLVYDNDFYPVDEDKPRPLYHADGPAGTWTWLNPWTPTSNADAWNHDRPVMSDGRHAGGPLMSYAGEGPSGLQFIVPRRRDAMDPYTFNVLGYNNDLFPSQIDPGPRHPVGDLRLEALWAPAGGAAASLKMTLGRPDNCYQVTWTAGGLELARYDMKAKTFERVEAEVAANAPRPQAGKAYRVAMNNVDHSVQFYVEGTRVLSYAETWSAADARAAERAEEEAGRSIRPDAEVRIEVEGPCTLAHLKLFRDLYYTQTETEQVARTANEGHPITLKEDEFFAMGDNSRRSLDSRMWTDVFPSLDDLGTRRGVVPRRYLLGQAFFVYWPAGYRASETLPVFSNLPLVPNTGDMRFIH